MYIHGAGDVGQVPRVKGALQQLSKRYGYIYFAQVPERVFFKYLYMSRRIYRGGFTDFTPEGVSALGSLPLWGNSKFYLMLGVYPIFTRGNFETPLQPYSRFDICP